MGADAAPRSVLVVPGHAARMHAKALSVDADEVVFDLEDAVLPADKATARERVAETLAEDAWRGRRVAVRINATGTPEHDDDVALCRALAADRELSVVLPKAEDADVVAAVARRLGVGVQALVETPRGLLAAPALAAVPGVRALILGYADLGAALGRRGDAGWRAHQELLVAAARAAGDVAAIDGPHFALRDERGLTAAARAVAALGFDGKWAIHPAQVDIINNVFAPTAAERDWATRVLAALDDAGAATVDGAMVDEAMARRARRLLATPGAAVAPEPEPAPPRPARRVAAPYYDDLTTGEVFASPGLTLTAGHAALHQAVIGDRLRLALDAELFAAVAGTPGVLAHPMLVCDVAIGQSTPPSGRVLGNLFYRGLGCRPVTIGTTLRTRTEVVARRDASRGRGMVALRVTTEDGAGAPILDFWRCPLLPGRPAGADDDLAAVGAPVDAGALVPRDWTLEPLRDTRLGPLFYDLHAGDRFAIEAAETVTCAPELARLSLNLAMTHTDATAGAYDRRLVYGGHVIGIAAAHLTRALPDLATILAWSSCDHRGPVFEGDRLRTSLEVVDLEPLADGGLVTLDAHVLATGDGEPDDLARPVLDWRLTALLP